MLRAFTATFRVAFNKDEADEDMPEPSIHEIKNWLRKALILDINTDEYGNPLGFLSAEVNIETTLTELPQEEVKEIYNLES